MNSYDSIIVPVLLTDGDGIIIYKNRAAKRCIPSPRLKANIRNYLNNRMKRFRVIHGSMRLEFIRNSESVFNRALVLGHPDGTELWCFVPELAIYEPEELERFIDRLDPVEVGSVLDNLDSCDEVQDRFLFNRYQRVYTDMLCAMKELSLEGKRIPFSACDVLESLKGKTAELALRYGLRMSVDMGSYEMYKNRYLELESFASVYIQLLSLCIRLTDTTGCAVTVASSSHGLNLTVTSALPEGGCATGSLSADILCNIYPKQASNIQLLMASVNSYGYTLNAYPLDGRLAITVSVPTDESDAVTLRQSVPAIIMQSRFGRLEKRFYEYMESIFMQI